MAFNPCGYQNPYYPPPMPDALAQYRQSQMMTQPMQQPITQPQGGVQWVGSEMEARNYLIAPNSAVALWDSSASRVYLKQADASGKPTLTAYDLVERKETPVSAQTVPAVSYVTREEFDRLAAIVGEMMGKKKEDNDDE